MEAGADGGEVGALLPVEGSRELLKQQLIGGDCDVSCAGYLRFKGVEIDHFVRMQVGGKTT